jgi:hypothetical protein
MAARKSLERGTDAGTSGTSPGRLANGAARHAERFVPAELPPLTTPRPPVEPPAWQPTERITRTPKAGEPAAETQPGEQAERLTLRRQLSEIGVPIDWVPADAPHRYAAVERLVARLPEAPPLPDASGDIVVMVGPAAAARSAAAGVAERMRVRPEQILTVGTGADDLRIEDPWQAATVAADLRLAADGPTILILAIDADADLRQSGELIAALRPEAYWAHVDATRKASDTTRMLGELGAPTALFVTGAERTASPASVWDAGLPIALLDGRPATRSAWAVLLLDKLAELES